MEEGHDPAWEEPYGTVGRGTPVEVAAILTRVMIDRVLPAAAPLVSDVAIRDHVLAGGGFANNARHGAIDVYELAILTAKHGPPDVLEAYAAELLGGKLAKRHAPLVARMRAGARYAPGFEPEVKRAKRK